MSIKISVVVPCYNSSNYIEECLESIRNQTYKNIEVFVIDNESTDNTYNIIKKYKKYFYIDKVKNIYPKCWDEAKNYGFSKSTGDYMTLVASDDIIQNNYISKCVKYIEENKPLIFHSPITGFNNFKKIVNYISYNHKDLNQLKEKLLIHCCINTPTVYYNREIYNMGLTEADPVNYSGAADYDLYCKIVDRNIFINNCTEWLGYYYRWHDQQSTWKMVQDPIKYDLLIRDKWRSKWKT